MSGKTIPYIEYHKQSAAMKDIDPANDCLTYIANRFELNMEQRYWLAFLYSTCYCGPTTFYMYNEFPDFENVDVPRLERWWKANKDRCVFQTDRLRIKSNNEFVPSFISYRDWVGGTSQQERFYRFKTPYLNQNYDMAYKSVGKIKNIGRFTLFIYLEIINLLTDFKCLPDTIDWKYADNCLSGLKYYLNQQYPSYSLKVLDWSTVLKKLMLRFPKSNIFNVETTLCAYHKYMKDQRYIGYYIDRQKKEIEKMKQNVTEGVCWRVLDEFRKETYKPHANLQEPI
jgi:hypothetical protein